MFAFEILRFSLLSRDYSCRYRCAALRCWPCSVCSHLVQTLASRICYVCLGPLRTCTLPLPWSIMVFIYASALPARGRECVYVLQMFFCFFVFFCFFPSAKNMRQPFSGTAERIFMKLLPNDTGENGVSNAVPK